VPATRDGLLDAAVGLIRGARRAGDLTVRKVVSRAGANLNAVNYHFGSKGELIREAVRVIIAGWFRANGIPRDGARGGGARATARLASGFLFAEPVASRLALDAELEAGGGGPSLTRETLEGLSAQLAAALPGLPEREVRLRAWVLLAAVHQAFLRPEGCREWLGADPTDRAAREALVERLVALVEVRP